jgi:probable phosphoglycerate mutase
MTAGTVLLVRHGRTDWNEQGRLQGWLEPGLSDPGRGDARTAAETVAKLVEARGGADATEGTVTAIVSSPLRRAAQTARVVADTVGDSSVDTDSRWRERRFGHVAGAESDAVFAALPEIYPRSGAFDAAARPPGGESVAGVADRVAAAWDDVVDRARDGATVAVVTHVTPLRLTLGTVRAHGTRDSVGSGDHPPGSVVAVSVEGSNAAVVDAGVRRAGKN